MLKAVMAKTLKIFLGKNDTKVDKILNILTVRIILKRNDTLPQK